jgi:hypothetical protein
MFIVKLALSSITPSLSPLKTRHAMELASAMVGTENNAEYTGGIGARTVMANTTFKPIVALNRKRVWYR